MEPPIDMSFRANTVSRGIFPSSRFYLTLVLSPTWWIPPLRWRCGRNDIMGDVFGFIGNGSVLSGAERHIGRSLRFRWKVLPLRLLFLQCGTWYRASSTAYGGPPSPKGKVLAFYLCAYCSYNAERGTAPFRLRRFHFDNKNGGKIAAVLRRYS